MTILQQCVSLIDLYEYNSLDKWRSFSANFSAICRRSCGFATLHVCI